MSGLKPDDLQAFEGRCISLALKGGQRIDDCQLISGGRSGTSSLWVFTNGMDVFVRADLVIDIWESHGRFSKAA